MVVGGTAVAKEAPAKPEIVARPIPAACSVSHYCFHCSWCGEPLLLPADRLGSPFGNPDARRIDAQSIASVCLRCKHIANYSMFRNCRGFDTRHRVMHSQRSGETVLLNWLRCTEPLCVKPVPLFVNTDPEMPLDETDAAQWHWDDLTCCLGHPVRPIPLDPTLQLPLRNLSGSR